MVGATARWTAPPVELPAVQRLLHLLHARLVGREWVGLDFLLERRWPLVHQAGDRLEEAGFGHQTRSTMALARLPWLWVWPLTRPGCSRLPRASITVADSGAEILDPLGDHHDLKQHDAHRRQDDKRPEGHGHLEERRLQRDHDARQFVGPEPAPRAMVMSMPCVAQMPLLQVPWYIACSPDGIRSVLETDLVPGRRRQGGQPRQRKRRQPGTSAER